MANDETDGPQSPPKIESAKTLFHKRIFRTINIFVMIAIILLGVRSCWNKSIENAKIPVNQEWQWVTLSPKGSITGQGEVKIIKIGYDFVFEAAYKNADKERKWAKCVIDGTSQNGTWIQSDPLPNGKYVAVLRGWKQTRVTDHRISQLIGHRDNSLMYIERIQ